MNSHSNQPEPTPLDQTIPKHMQQTTTRARDICISPAPQLFLVKCTPPLKSGVWAGAFFGQVNLAYRRLLVIGDCRIYTSRHRKLYLQLVLSPPVDLFTCKALLVIGLDATKEVTTTDSDKNPAFYNFKSYQANWELFVHLDITLFHSIRTAQRPFRTRC